MMKLKAIGLLTAAVAIIIACNNETFNQGEALYLQHCANCHGNAGEGFQRMYPPLNQADFLEQNTDLVACYIQNGMSGEIYVNGIMYDQPMPANKELSDIEIANIVNYVSNKFTTAKKYYSLDEVQAQLRACRAEN